MFLHDGPGRLLESDGNVGPREMIITSPLVGDRIRLINLIKHYLYMKKIELTLLGILVPLDYLMLILAGIFSYFVRFTSKITELRPVIFDLPFNNFLQLLLITAIGWLIVFAFNGLYNIEKNKSLIKTLIQIIIASTAATMLIIVAFFFNQRLFNSRLIILIFWLTSIFFVFFGRFIHYLIYKLFYLKGFIVKNAIIIGQDNNTKTLISEFKKNKKYSLKIIESYPLFDEKVKNDISFLLTKTKIDEIIFADSNHTSQQINELINFCYDNHLIFRYAASLYDTKLKNFEIKTIVGIPLIEMKNTALEGWGEIFKRIFDLIFSFFVLLILSPLFLIISLIIKLDSAGPIIVNLERMGEKNKKFKLYKFRSMIKNAHLLKPQIQSYNERNDGPLFKMKDDPRITRFGKILRKYSLDELPQFINVFKGEMSLVGPRPHEPEEVARYETHHKKLLNIKPGITGLAAVSGRSDLLFEEEAKLDTYYIENWNLFLDLQIILKTPKAVFCKRNAP